MKTKPILIKESELFENKITSFSNEKNKYLLKPKYQKEVLSIVKEITKNLAKSKKIIKIFIGGSIALNELGKYEKRWNERDYSDIDLFILLKGNLSDYLSKEKLNKIGLTKKLYLLKSKKYYRISVSDSDGEPLKIFGLFSVDAWLMSKSSMKKDIKKFPNLLKNTIEIKGGKNAADKNNKS